jgi:hypothetical protein
VASFRKAFKGLSPDCLRSFDLINRAGGDGLPIGYRSEQIPVDSDESVLHVNQADPRANGVVNCSGELCGLNLGVFDVMRYVD